MKKEATYFFEEAPNSKAIAHLGIPMMIGMLVFIVYNIVDTLFIGFLGDPTLIAAATLAMPVFTILMGIATIFGVGGGTYISRLIGEKNYETAKNVSSFAFYVLVIIGAIVTALGFLFIKPILSILGTSPGTFNPTRDYVLIIIAGSISTMLSFSLGQILRAEGAAKVSMTGMMIGTVSNIVLDPLFIFLFGWGIKGAAIATVLANVLSVLYYIFYLAKKSEFLSLKIADFRVTKEIATPIFSIGLPVFLRELVVIVVSIVQNNLAAGYGDIYIAIFGVIAKVRMLPKALAQGLCQGVQPLLGYNFAAKKTDRLKSILKLTGIYCTAFCIVIFTGIFIVSANVLKAFINDVGIIAIGTPFLRISLISYLTYGVVFLFTNLFQAVGLAKPASAMSLTMLFFFIPVLLVANYMVGINGFAWALPISDVLTMVLSIILYRINWRKIMVQ
jgi:multidrug efflux pump